MRLFTIFSILYILLQDPVKCIPLEEFYPFGITENDTFLYSNDDGSSPPIILTSAFPFFDENYEIIYVRMNLQ